MRHQHKALPTNSPPRPPDLCLLTAAPAPLISMQACILAVGGTEKRVVAAEGKGAGFEEGTFMVATMSCDHRVVRERVCVRGGEGGPWGCVHTVGGGKLVGMHAWLCLNTHPARRCGDSPQKLASVVTGPLPPICAAQVDGAVAAQWLQAFKRYVENPASMLL
jgi:hypothetical protein